MISLYRPGSSLVHRAPAGLKVLLFACFAIAVSVLAGSAWAGSAWSLPVAAAITVAAYLLAGFGASEIVAQVLAVRWVVVVMLVTQLIFLPFAIAATTTARVLTVIVLASLITLTTRIPDLLDATERALGPFARFGVNPRAIGLLLAITITTIPVIAGFAGTIREAQRARGVPVRLGTFVVPLLVMSLKHSDDLADALAARGLE
ncbi:energy-coupling factor transporter transmembrane protein EcfT [Subtercola sp. PAMC28395]|uniref:energy-coupling factor transporter transmembrane component T family protein n=1 Tax=Subtercola sp. PAMC28395 TaxID=2846775 RepID=UPI001C0B50EB|nr:energy-coupling factor transporter transmembrane protein EcfT [Subtercola sp. PAMC28395]QWT23862.1 energy-coupling factor transporter transmembrane protein EcfT [Subtercola sp. PAMC28395]